MPPAHPKNPPPVLKVANKGWWWWWWGIPSHLNHFPGVIVPTARVGKFSNSFFIELAQICILFIYLPTYLFIYSFILAGPTQEISGWTRVRGWGWVPRGVWGGGGPGSPPHPQHPRALQRIAAGPGLAGSRFPSPPREKKEEGKKTILANCHLSGEAAGRGPGGGREGGG